MNNDFTLNLNSKNNIAYHKSHNENWNVTLVNTGLDTKKGTRIKQIEPYIKNDRFMVTYGDGLGNIDVKGLIDCHLKNVKRGKLATFTGVHPISRFATINLDKKGEVIFWKEKRKIEEYINAGFFILEKEIFDYLDSDCELEKKPMENLAKEKRISMYKHEGFWHCMDTYRDYKFLNNLWIQNKAPWKLWK
jgi:glucose-1-phosphate cytidylyltransferase